MVTIRRARDVGPCLDGLVDVLVDCVDRGASVGFLAPLTPERARAFWSRVGDHVGSGARALLVAELDGRIVGTVQLALDLPENQPHRADLAKMLVHGAARRQGVAAALLAAAEATARDEGRSLLVLDTVRGSDAERLYVRAGWQRAGSVPGYALMPDGSPCDTTYYYKALPEPAKRRPG